ncbi:hypothetical protein B0H14DRAFT_2641045 [Mycena olivaceomarginata]|nr:hypothetical protein B0H14DRAFT_2641045 [Mycena olivaceomarginata]
MVHSWSIPQCQHHWTNQRTDVKLTILEAVESARKVNFKTAREVKDSLDTGILDNNSNNIFHRMQRKGQRNANTVQFNAAKAAKKLTDLALKDAQAKLSEAKGKTRRKRGSGTTGTAAEPLLEATSSGRVISPQRTMTRTRTTSVSVAPPPLPPLPGLAAAPFSATISEPLFSGFRAAALPHCPSDGGTCGPTLLCDGFRVALLYGFRAAAFSHLQRVFS